VFVQEENKVVDVLEAEADYNPSLETVPEVVVEVQTPFLLMVGVVE
jgi:hypothetical protein